MDALLFPSSSPLLLLLLLSSLASRRSFSAELSKSGNEPRGVAGQDFVIKEFESFRVPNEVDSI